LEKARKKFLEKHHLINSYMKWRFNYYFKNWYLKRLEMVKPGDYRKAMLFLIEIYHLYDDKNMDSEIKEKMTELKSNMYKESN